MKLVSGNSNRDLAENIGKYLNTPLANCTVKKFSDKEIFVEMNENCRGEDVFIIQSTSFPANDNLMELLILIDTLKRASAKRITAVIPYYGYARQDRKPGPRTPITAMFLAFALTKNLLIMKPVLISCIASFLIARAFNEESIYERQIQIELED